MMMRGILFTLVSIWTALAIAHEGESYSTSTNDDYSGINPTYTGPAWNPSTALNFASLASQLPAYTSRPATSSCSSSSSKHHSTLSTTTRAHLFSTGIANGTSTTTARVTTSSGMSGTGSVTSASPTGATGATTTGTSVPPVSTGAADKVGAGAVVLGMGMGLGMGLVGLM